MADPRQMSRIKSDQKYIKEISAEIVNYVRNARPQTHHDILFDIKLCIEEAVRNAIIHGNKSREDLPVDISYGIEDNMITISVEDRGEGFSVIKLPDPTDEENLHKESGRGVYIIHKLMDDVEYSKKGNRVTMKKRLS